MVWPTHRAALHHQDEGEEAEGEGGRWCIPKVTAGAAEEKNMKRMELRMRKWRPSIQSRCQSGSRFFKSATMPEPIHRQPLPTFFAWQERCSHAARRLDGHHQWHLLGLFGLLGTDMRQSHPLVRCCNGVVQGKVNFCEKVIVPHQISEFAATREERGQQGKQPYTDFHSLLLTQKNGFRMLGHL